MKILLTGDFSEVMLKQPKHTVSDFVEAIDKLQDLAKPQILLLETVVDISSHDDDEKLYAYHISGNKYAIFSFTPKNELLLIDYVQISGKSITSLTYPDTSTSNKPFNT